MPLVDSAALRARFPALAAHPQITYLDSASTTQKPDVVVAAVTRYLSDGTANAGRGSYPWANRVTREVERVRERVAAFLGAAGPDEIVFTAGATASLHAVALSWGLATLADGDEILYNPRDHAANVEPWRRLRHLLARHGTTISLTPYALTGTGEADVADIRARTGPRTRLITVSHVHNVYGSLSTLEELDVPVPRCREPIPQPPAYGPRLHHGALVTAAKHSVPGGHRLTPGPVTAPADPTRRPGKAETAQSKYQRP